MIDFGNIKIFNESTSNLARGKISDLLRTLNFNPIRSVRISTVIGEISKTIIHDSRSIDLQIHFENRQKKEIHFKFIIFEWETPKDFIEEYKIFFSNISSGDLDGSTKFLYLSILLTKENPLLNEEIIEEIRTKLTVKSREELTGELTYKNEELKEINHSMSKFVPSDFLKSLGKENIKDFRLGDAAQHSTTILFTDMRSFSTISEKLTPSELISFINLFLSYVVPIIHTHNGYVLTYLGDAIMTAFPNSVTDAINCAKDMLLALEKMNEDIKETQSHPIRVGIGINYGSVMIGIIGGEGRMEPTILSDVVNLSSRLEGLTKKYGAEILISEFAYTKLMEENPDKFEMRFVDEVRVMGRNTPTKIYEILHEDLTRFQKKIQSRKELETIVRHYREKNWKPARSLILKLKEFIPEDLVLDLYLDRLEDLILSYETLEKWEPIHNWDRK
ncbi:MAG: adenylate/guanylate cyclase domain-containing protein [Leptospiraceae bacterium]|nr:adenylate/guanylate cyclase domain-containing protein [Leptospiraceae bacterium]